MAAGGALGGARGKLRDTGIKTGDMKEIGNALEPGKVAVVALAEPAWTPAIERALEVGDGKLVRHGFSAEETQAIEAAAATDEADATDASGVAT
jgi:uncharacterized membrane protein